jgi:hypothetical protein
MCDTNNGQKLRPGEGLAWNWESSFLLAFGPPGGLCNLVLEARDHPLQLVDCRSAIRVDRAFSSVLPTNFLRGAGTTMRA